VIALVRIARRALAISCLGAFLVPGLAHAGQGVNLRWQHCFGDGGTQNRTFACNTNTAGFQAMTGSFELASDMANVIGTEIVLQLAADSPTLPPWWQFRNAGSCRPLALIASMAVNPTDVICLDWSSATMSGGLAAYCTVDFPCPGPPPGPNSAVIKVVNAVPPDFAAALTGGVEYFDFALNLANVKTVGPDACAGCNVPVCIVLNSIDVVARDNVEHRFISGPTAPGSNFATWQGGGSPSVGGITGCPAATPARRSTWGSLKSLYR